MSVDLSRLASADRTALVIFEMQRGVAGDLHLIPALGAAVRSAGIVARLATLADAARRADVPVVHCVAAWRRDRVGTMLNTPLVAALSRRHPEHILAGSPGAQIIPELGPHDGDLISRRRSGLSGFAGTDLDTTLRALGVETVVLTGVGLTLGLLATTIEAVHHGYSAVLPRDGVVDIDADYGQLVWDRTIRLVAARTSVDELVGIWEPDAQAAG